MAQFNADDPRYQREIQRAAAKRSMGPARLERATTGEIAGRHAGYQLGRQEQFKRLALQSQLSRQQGEQFDKTLGLNTRKQAFREKEFNTNLGREKSGLNQTMLMGLLGTGISEMEARRREKILQSQLAQRNVDRDRLNAYIDSAVARRGGRTDEGTLLPERFLGGKY